MGGGLGRADRSEGGQSTVEFALAVIIFVTLLCGVFDLGRGVYQNNGLAQAAR